MMRGLGGGGAAGGMYGGFGNAQVIKPKIWATDYFVSEFCDAFADDLDTQLEIFDTWTAFKDMTEFLKKEAEAKETFTPSTSEKLAACMTKLHSAVEASEGLYRKFQSYNQWKMQYYLSKVMEDITKAINGVAEPDDIAILPLQIPGTSSTISLVVQYEAKSTVRVTIVNPVSDSDYHAKSAMTENPSKIKQQICMTVSSVPRNRITSEAWWSCVFMSAKSLDEEAVFYTHLLSWLTGRTLEGQIADNFAENVYSTPVKSECSSYWKSLVHVLKFYLTKQGFATKEVKFIRHYVKQYMLNVVETDLGKVKGIKRSTKKIVTSAIENTAVSISRNEAMFPADKLEKARVRIEKLLTQLEHMRCEDESLTQAPPLLEIDQGWDMLQQPDSFPLMECFRRIEGTDQFAGAAIEQVRTVPANFLRIPSAVQTYDEALAAIDEAVLLTTRVSTQLALSKNRHYLIGAAIAHLFLSVLPMPLGPKSRLKKKCIWRDTPMRYGQQLHLMKRLHELVEFYACAMFGFNNSIEIDSVRVVVFGAAAAIADALIRVKATDKPSLFSVHLTGYRGKNAFGITPGHFKKQSQNMQFVFPEGLPVRCAILDYFDEVNESVPDPNIIWKWENGVGIVDKGLRKLLRQLGHSEAYTGQAEPMKLLESNYSGQFSVLCRQFTEVAYYRDMVFLFKFSMSDLTLNTQDWLGSFNVNLRFECNGEGYNVYGFEGSTLKTEAKQRFADFANVTKYTFPHDVHSEEDILHIKNLTTFDGVMGQRDAELLLSYLTVPYIRIPLVLRFFATEDRVSTLKNSSIQNLMQSVLFNAGRFLTLKYSGRTPTEVPAEKADMVAAPYGQLLHEIMYSPEGVLGPIVRLVHLAAELDSGTVYNTTTTTVILFLVRTVARVHHYVRFTLDLQEGKVKNTDLLRDIEIREEVRAKTEEAYVTLKELILSNIMPMLETWIQEAMSKVVASQKSDDVDRATSLAAKIHAHVIMLLRNVRERDYDDNFVGMILSSFTFLTTRYSWSTNHFNEFDLYTVIHSHRRSIVRHLSQCDTDRLSAIMDAVVRIVTSSGHRSGGRTHTWGLVAGHDCVGRFARIDDEIMKRPGRDKGVPELLATMERHLGIGHISPDIVTIAEGMQDVELNVHTLTLTFKNAHLRALPSDIVQDPDVANVFAYSAGNKEKVLESMQCAIVEDSVNRQWIRLVGQDHDIQYWRTPDPRFPIPADNMVRFYPDDLSETEQWVHELFEPVRQLYFERSFWDPPIFVLIQEIKLTKDNSVATLSAVDSQSGRKLKEVLVFRDFRCVHIYDVFSFGRRFHRRLVYSSDNRYCQHQLHCAIDRRARPWSWWNRHQAGDPDPDSRTEQSATCVIIRHPTHPDNISKSTETYVPRSLLFGLIPSALLDTHMFYQDADDNIRGYPMPENDEDKPTHLLWLHWRETQFDPIGSKNTCVQVFRFARAAEAPRASEEATLRSEKVKIQDETEEELGMTRAASYDAAAAELEAGAFRQSSQVFSHKQTELASIEDHNLMLIDLMYSRKGTPLHSLAKVFTRIELLSHILVWTTKTDYDANDGTPFTVDLIQLPRLKLSFAARLNPDGSGYKVYSLDHAHLFVSNLRPSLLGGLIQGVPHSLILADTNNSISILVPSLNVVRPTITTSPFSTEIVIHRGDVQWYTKLDTRYYLFPVHVSLSFLFTPTLASALYLLLLRFYNRNYTDVFRLSGTIGTDMEFTPEEVQIFNKLNFIHDSNPNAHACRAKISLLVADSPVTTGWYAPRETSLMIAKYTHVNVSCRMSQSEERRLLYIACMLEKKMGVIREFCRKSQNVEGFQLAQKTLQSKAEEFTLQQRRVLRLFIAGLTTELRERLDVRVVKDDLLRLMSIYTAHCLQPMKEYRSCLLQNRRTIIESEMETEGNFDPRKVELRVPKMGKDLQWLFYTDFNALSAKPPGTTMKQKNDEGRTMASSKSWDYYYCGSQVRKSGQCRCRSCGENCGADKGCPCSSCEKYNRAEGHLIRELIPALDVSRSARTLSFFETFLWIAEVMQRYANSRPNEEFPYMDKNPAMTLREPMNSFLRYYELVTGTTKVKICSGESARDLAQILFHFSRDARNTASGLGHMMHFVLANPSCYTKLLKFNRTSKQKADQKTLAIYNSIWSQAASFRDPHCDISEFPKCEVLPTMVLEIFPRKDSRTIEVPLHLTTILPIPRNTDDNKRVLGIPDVKHLQLLGDEQSRLDVTPQLLGDLAGLPLAPVLDRAFVKRMTRSEQQLEPISPELPFDLSRHEHARKTVARDMLSRVSKDMNDFAAMENESAVPKLVGLATDAEVRAVVCGKTTPALTELRKKLTSLNDRLQALRTKDQEFLSYAMPAITRTANHIEFTAARSSTLLFLRRLAKKEATLSLDFLIASLCSSSGEQELRELNPFLSMATCGALMELITVAVLRANRVGHANRACEVTSDLLALLNKADRFPETLSGVQLKSFIDACVASMSQKADSLAAQLLTPRCFIDPKTMEYDPRFLLFEFTWNLVLRDRQRELIMEMHESITKDVSIVKQMIMGAGKTTVVGPVLALMLADSNNLVMQVVPPALLDFTRAVLRTTFSSVLQKQIFTFVCDRASEIDSEMLSKFEHAKKSRGIIVTTPSSIKSIFLKYVEGLDKIVDDRRDDRTVENEKEAVDLLNVLKLWRKSVLIMDEVDMLLHPLKSELNFPIGHKHDIDFTPTRWKLPIHLIDAIFFYHTHRITTMMKDSPDAVEILIKFKKAVQNGLDCNALQEMPHLTLLNLDYYDAELKPILAQWAVLFLKSQHLVGLSDEETVRYLIRRPTVEKEPAFVEKVSNLEEAHVKMLNLTFEWLSCFMPHVMQKIDRVSFGIMNHDDMRRAKEDHPNMPRSRFVTAIPFIGKDLPSQSSEFAHPDVVIGLTIMAYRYEGIRNNDFVTVMRELHAAVEKEVGRYNQRRTNVMFTKWVQAAGGRIISTYSYEKKRTVEREEMGMQPSESTVFDADGMVIEDRIIDVLPLKLLKQANQVEIDKLYKLFKRTAEVIHWYLCESIFPEFMRHQHAKLSASGQELGGNMIFDRRIGFSGTPSDLLPLELGQCAYERGTDGQLIHTLTDDRVMSFRVVNSGWTVRQLLDTVACANPPFHALIDTGALITGMSNLQVAQYLIKNGLQQMEGVVFLDELDRKMILVRATGRVLKLAECGIPKVKRFAFYDQVHTTGMDIEHMPNAQAVQTLGKDMTFRDFSQGAYRMRGIGQGQTVHLLIIPEVYDLINRTLTQMRKGVALPSLSERHATAVLQDVSAWLLVNSIRSEHTQHNQLCIQSCANVWRKEAFRTLSECAHEFKVSSKPSERAQKALSVYREPISFDIPAHVPQPRMFSENVAMYVESHSELITSAGGKEVVQGIMDQTKREDEIDNPVIDVQMVQEQEEEKETEQEQEKEQEIEIEKFVDLAYSRDEEHYTPWKLETLTDPVRAAQFYKLASFHLYKRRPINFPDSIYLSRNFFNPKHSGHRRIKNVIVTMEWIPDTKKLEVRTVPSEDYAAIEESRGKPQLTRTVSMVTDHEKELDASLVRDILSTALHISADDNGAGGVESKRWDNVVQRILAGASSGKASTSEVFFEELCGNSLRAEESGRFTVAVTLLEAETLRRVIHQRMHAADGALIDGAKTAIALNVVPSTNALLDASTEFKTALTPYFPLRNYQCMRFFDCDLHYTDQEFGLLMRAVHNNSEKLRQAFFQQTISCRRRARQRWESTPIALLFVMRDAFALLHQRAVGLCVKRHLASIELNLGDAFMAFNSSHSGVLGPDEVWGAMKFCDLDLSIDEVLDFIDTADTAREGNIQYPDFLAALTGSRELEDEDSAVPTAEDMQGKKLPTVEAFGLELLKAARAERLRKQRAQEAEANKEMEDENQRVMDEIENEQIAEELQLVNQTGNPLLDEDSLTFSFMHPVIPRLLQPYGARVHRCDEDLLADDDARHVVMTSNSGIKMSLRLLKRLRNGDIRVPGYCFTTEFRLPRLTQGDTKKGCLEHLGRMGKSINLMQWTIPMFRFPGYNASNIPQFETEVWGISKATSSEVQETSGLKKRKSSTRAETSTDTTSAVPEVVHLFKEPRPGRKPEDAIGEIPTGGFVVAEHGPQAKVSNSIDGVTYEWMLISYPMEGWCVREKNGKTLFEQLATTISMSQSSFTIDQSAVGTLLEKFGTFEVLDEEEKQTEETAAVNVDVEDDNPVELNNDVRDLLEAIRKAKILRPGDRVTRNPACWDKGNEDGGSGKTGKVLKVETEKVHVQWPGGNKGQYEWGKQGRFELIKVGEADSDDEGEVREVMNDERWLPEMRKGGQKCNGCNAQKLEPTNWYKCNHCDQYNLCKKCFRQGTHSEHDFTDMGALSQSAATEVGPGAFVRIKLSVTNPKHGWQGAAPGMTGTVIEFDADEGSATVELSGDVEFQCDVNEIELAKNEGDDEDEGAAKQGALYGFIQCLEGQPNYPFVDALVGAARVATQGRFRPGDRVIARVNNTWFPGEVRALVPLESGRTYAVSTDDGGYHTDVTEANLRVFRFRMHDRVRYQRKLLKNPQNLKSGLGGLSVKDMETQVGTVVEIPSQRDPDIRVRVDFMDGTVRNRCYVSELDVIGSGKWTLTKDVAVAPTTEEGEASSAPAATKKEVAPLPTSSNVIVERAFQDGQQLLQVFIRDDTYDVDFATMEVRKDKTLVGTIARDPPEIFIKGEEKKQLDDGFTHVVSVIVSPEHGVTIFCDGKQMPVTMMGALQSIKDVDKRKEVQANAMNLLSHTPVNVFYSQASAEVAKQSLGPCGNSFPVRHVSWMRMDWGPATAEEVLAWHACIDREHQWICKECKEKNSRLVAICTECKAPRVAKKSKQLDNTGKFRSALPKSRESASVRAKLQSKLRAQYQRELDVLDEAQTKDKDDKTSSRIGTNIAR